MGAQWTDKIGMTEMLPKLRRELALQITVFCMCSISTKKQLILVDTNLTLKKKVPRTTPDPEILIADEAHARDIASKGILGQSYSRANI